MNDNASPAPAGVSRPASPLNPWLFVALAALGLAGWQWFETRERLLDAQQEIARRLGEADDADKEARGALHHLEEQVADLQARNGALETRVAEFQGQTAALQGLYQDISRARDEAALLEVEQTLALAAQQLQLTGNVPAAVLALQSADARLARQDRPQFAGLRKALARDLDKLRALPLVDVAGMSLKLENALAAIDRLPLASEGRPGARREAPAAPAQAQPLPWWQRAGGDLWQEIKGLVRIQRLDRTEPALLAPGQAYFLRENLKLRLLNARLALLAREQGVYRGELKAAQDLLARHFDGQDKAVQAAATTLRQLTATELNIEVPGLSDSLAALRAVRAGKGGK